MQDQTVITESVQRDSELSTAKPQISEVRFHNTIIPCAIDPDGKIYVGVRPICEAIGMDTKKALLSIKKDPILGGKDTVRYLLDAQNRKFPMQCIPIEYLPGWLFSISDSRIKASARENLMLFKKECHVVLFNHFFGKYRILESAMNEKVQLRNEVHTLYQQKYQVEKRIRQLKARMELIETNVTNGQYSLPEGGSYGS